MPKMYSIGAGQVDVAREFGDKIVGVIGMQAQLDFPRWREQNRVGRQDGVDRASVVVAKKNVETLIA